MRSPVKEKITSITADLITHKPCCLPHSQPRPFHGALSLTLYIINAAWPIICVRVAVRSRALPLAG